MFALRSSLFALRQKLHVSPLTTSQLHLGISAVIAIPRLGLKSSLSMTEGDWLNPLAKSE
jgi:hypothetical protein